MCLCLEFFGVIKSAQAALITHTVDVRVELAAAQYFLVSHTAQAAFISTPVQLQVEKMSHINTSSQAPEQDEKETSHITTRSHAHEQDEKDSHDKELSEKELDLKAAHGETVVKGGTGGLSLAAQERLAAGRKAGGETRKKQITHEAYAELGKKGHDHHTQSSPAGGSEAV